MVGEHASRDRGRTLTGRYAQVNKLVFFRVYLVAGSTTTQGAGSQNFALPVAAHATGEQEVLAKLYNGSAAFAGVGYILAGGSVVSPVVPASTSDCSLTGLITGGQNVGTTGNLAISGWYEAA